MNSIKIQSDILSLIKRKKNNEILVDCTEDYYLVGRNQHIYFIKNDEFWLDYNKLLTECKSVSIANKIMNPTKDYYEFSKTGNIKILGKNKAVEFISDSGRKKYLDEAVLKVLSDDIKFFSDDNERTPFLAAYDESNIEAFILPFII